MHELDILFLSEKSREEFNDSAKRKGRHGEKRGKLIGRRLDDLRAAINLETMSMLPGHCHELKGGRKGQLAINLDGLYRMIFEVANDPVPMKPDGGLDRSRVSAIRILSIEDYHG